ncbi:Hypothetical_protein [Hexamita inflata]|uniref:Hypothetical_protein n=1 Tax=Hexamita inflata TaxID=28002 RepID=A0AA86P357_9EUKA|nr:Hypothetical protein HINF_LOCUS17665 [Hexamita inflata]
MSLQIPSPIIENEDINNMDSLYLTNEGKTTLAQLLSKGHTLEIERVKQEVKHAKPSDMTIQTTPQNQKQNQLQQSIPNPNWFINSFGTQSKELSLSALQQSLTKELMFMEHLLDKSKPDYQMNNSQELRGSLKQGILMRLGYRAAEPTSSPEIDLNDIKSPPKAVEISNLSDSASSDVVKNQIISVDPEKEQKMMSQKEEVIDYKRQKAEMLRNIAEIKNEKNYITENVLLEPKENYYLKSNVEDNSENLSRKSDFSSTAEDTQLNKKQQERIDKQNQKAQLENHQMLHKIDHVKEKLQKKLNSSPISKISIKKADSLTKSFNLSKSISKSDSDVKTKPKTSRPSSKSLKSSSEPKTIKSPSLLKSKSVKDSTKSTIKPKTPKSPSKAQKEPQNELEFDIDYKKLEKSIPKTNPYDVETKKTKQKIIEEQKMKEEKQLQEEMNRVSTINSFKKSEIIKMNLDEEVKQQILKLNEPIARSLSNSMSSKFSPNLNLSARKMQNSREMQNSQNEQVYSELSGSKRRIQEQMQKDLFSPSNNKLYTSVNESKLVKSESENILSERDSPQNIIHVNSVYNEKLLYSAFKNWQKLFILKQNEDQQTKQQKLAEIYKIFTLVRTKNCQRIALKRLRMYFRAKMFSNERKYKIAQNTFQLNNCFSKYAVEDQLS